MAITISGSGITSANIADGTITASDINSAVELGVTDAEKVDLKSGRKNLLINGGFDVWQRGTSTTTGFFADRFQGNHSGHTTTKSTDVPTGKGFGSSAQFVGNGPDPYFYQNVEGSAAVAGRVATFSFWIKGGLGQCYIYDGSYHAVSTTLIETVGSWTRRSITYTFATGSYNPLVRIGLPTNNSNTCHTTGWQLELGSVATDFEHRSYGEELALCQRYFLATPFAGAGVYNTDASFFCMIGNGVPFRTIPSISSKTGVWTNINIEKSDTYDISAVTFQHNVAAPLFNERPLISFTVPTRSGYAGQGGVAMMDRNSDLFYFDAEL